MRNDQFYYEGYFQCTSKKTTLLKYIKTFHTNDTTTIYTTSV